MDGTHFNTTKESGDELKRIKEVCGKQERRILEMFRQYKYLSPYQVFIEYNMDNERVSVPITSVRRAINILTSKEFLEKTTTKIRGAYGRNEYIWKLKEN